MTLHETARFAADFLSDTRHSVSDEPQHTFEVYIDDSRYSVPTLHLIAADEAGAIEAVRRMLDDSPYHLGAELCLDGVRLIGLGSYADGRAALEDRAAE